MRPKTIICFAVLMSIVVSIEGQTTQSTTSSESGPHFCEALEANKYEIDYTISSPWSHFFVKWISIRGWTWDIVYSEGKVFLNAIYGIKYNEDSDEIFKRDFKCLFNIRRGTAYHNYTTGVVSDDYRKVYWIMIDRFKDKTRAQESPVQDFNTDFDKSQFTPHMSFNTIKNINSSLIFFIETNEDNKTGYYRNRIQIYDFPVPKVTIWKNVTDSKQSEVPVAIRDTASKYKIKGVFPVVMPNDVNGSIILIELCPTNKIPCPQTVTYKHCLVPNNETNPTDEGKPCNRNNLELLYDCSGWINNSGKPELTTIPTTIEEVSNQTERETTATKIEVTDTTVTPSASEEPKSGMGWLWILLIVIILVILLIALLLFCCLRRKSKEPKEAPVPPSDDTEKTSMATMEAQPKSGLPESTSTLSTASNRSGVDGQSSKVGADKSQMSSMPSSLSTTSNRSGFNKSNAGQSSAIGPKGSNGSTPNGSQTSNITPSSMSTASTRSGVKNSGI